MRHFPHRVKVTHTDSVPGSPTRTIHESLPCRFAYMDAIKNEQLFGAQTSQGTVTIPKHYEIVEEGTALEEYEFTPVSPPPNNLTKRFQPTVERLSQHFRQFQVQIFQY